MSKPLTSKPLTDFVKARQMQQEILARTSTVKRTGFAKIKYEITKWGVFFVPIVLFYLIGYAIFQNHIQAFISMIFLLFIMVVIIFIWYGRKENLFAKF